MSIKFKPLLPEDSFTLDVQTKLLPTKGNLVYEYNPFRNYRLNETRFQYNNRFYTEQELINNLNIISNVVYIKDPTLKCIIARYSGYTRNSSNEILLQFTYTRFDIFNYLGSVKFALPRFNNKYLNFYFQEASILGNNELTQIQIWKNSNNKPILKTSNDKYVIGYDVENNMFIYGDNEEDAFIGVDCDYSISKKGFKNLSFHYKSDCFYQVVNESIYEINEQIDKFHAGSLVDFSTNELNFSLEHPIQIVPQYAYDGSVNLILSDGKSKPKLINSRFSSTGKNTYQIVDRKGNNDTNIYNQGAQFDIDTSLYKQTSYIPKLSLRSVYTGGQLPVGNYHFYITYADSDGNETDFVAESGLVSLFLGTDEYSIRQGFRNENSFKGVKLVLTNIDPSYSYINVYYTRSTGDLLQNADTLAYKIADPIFITNTQEQELNITGYEEVSGISISDINPLYHVVESAETLAVSKNMLFLGNVQKQTPDYTKLADLALYFTPILDTSESYKNQDELYTAGVENTYQDPNYIYDKVGYWPEEIYRFGIVFIQSDNTLTPVFNVRGINNLSENNKYTSFDIYKDGIRQFIDVNENTHLLISGNTQELENAKGVVRLHSTASNTHNPVYGIKFVITANNRNDVLDELAKHCKGYFFVRQRRIPTVLCEAITIGTDKHSHHPCLPINGSIINSLENKKQIKKNTSVKLPNSDNFVVVDSTDVRNFCPYGSFSKTAIGYIMESFMNMHREIVNDFEQHLRVLNRGQVNVNAMLCPDYDINYPYYNNIFNGAKFTLLKSPWQPSNEYLNIDLGQRHLYFKDYKHLTNTEYGTVRDVKILGVEDSTPLVGLNDHMYSGVAGIHSMGYKFDYIGSEDKTTEASNIIRGIWGPFLAIDSLSKLNPCTTYMIMIPGYNPDDMENYFKIRYSDKNAYYAISDRFLLEDIDENENNPIYRGDCYICQFTHRMNRNFNDDSAPYNDVIVNKGTWRGENNGENEDNEPNPGCEYKDGTLVIENFDNINLGDINAAMLGHWVTFQLRSSFNLNVRAIDDSDVNEVTKIGHGKGFFPYYPLSATGSYKTPEALCVNKGYEKSVSERYQFTHPDVPASKNVFCNRILHSMPASNDAYKNGYRVFKKTSFADYQLTYGSITKILEWKESLLVIFEHGIGLAGINEKALLSNAQSANVYLETDKVLPKDVTIISDCYGSQWKDSIIKTPYAVYGVDTTAKKIWKMSNEGLECISDKTVQSFLNNNISLTERELIPIVGIRNVKTHYNRFKNDVMFTFYDDLENSQEKIWNLCYNENMQQFVTFYSWVPSYSDNIYNSFFSFDRQTSKWIAKLGQSIEGSDFAQNIVLDGYSILPDPEIVKSGENCVFGNLKLNNVEYSEVVDFKILRDNLQNFKLFNIKKEEVEGGNTFKLVLNKGVKALDLVSELYYRTTNGHDKLMYIPGAAGTSDVSYGDRLLSNSIYQSLYLPIYHGSNKRRMELPNPINKNKIVYVLNIECSYITVTGAPRTLTSSVAVTLQYNLQFLTTDFWRHGQAGIIDISERLKPTHWYGKQHPFEFEFIVAKNPANQKIFDNLIIIGNSAEPESFHYQIDGDSYEFQKDKPTMYYRQEATEAFYQYHGQDIEYDTNFTEVKDQLYHKPLYNISKESLAENDYKEYFKDSDVKDSNGNSIFVKSNLFSLYYSRINSYNEIEDYYRQQITANKNYDALSGAEVVWDSVTNTYKLWSHAKAVDVRGPGGRIRGNMQYLEDRWNVQINPMNIRQKNESDWSVPPIVLQNSPIPDETIRTEGNNLVLNSSYLNKNDLFPEVLHKQGYVDTNNLDDTLWDSTKQVKLRDKYLRIRIRYSGKELAVIQAVQTLFRLSFA